MFINSFAKNKSKSNYWVPIVKRKNMSNKNFVL